MEEEERGEGREEKIMMMFFQTCDIIKRPGQNFLTADT